MTDKNLQPVYTSYLDTQNCKYVRITREEMLRRIVESMTVMVKSIDAYLTNTEDK